MSRWVGRMFDGCESQFCILVVCFTVTGVVLVGCSVGELAKRVAALESANELRIAVEALEATTEAGK